MHEPLYAETTGPPHVSDVYSSAVSLNLEDESDHIFCEILSFCEGATSDCFPEEEHHEVHSFSLRRSRQNCELIITEPVFFVWFSLRASKRTQRDASLQALLLPCLTPLWTC